MENRERGTIGNIIKTWYIYHEINVARKSIGVEMDSDDVI